MRLNRGVVSLVALVLFAAGPRAAAADPFNAVADEVNQKVVKLYGAGGFRGITNYGTGLIVSPDGHILTVASQMLETSELIVHLADGRRMRATVLVTEPELDVALLKIKVEGKKPDEATGLDLPYFDVPAAARRPHAGPGTWVLSFSNCFEIAMRDEPVSVTRGVVAAYTKLHGRRGVFDFAYTGDVYMVDAVTNNPGAGGGALTDRTGALLGIVGRELKNAQSETWVNYAIPVAAKMEVRDGDKAVTVSIPEFVEKAKRGQYKPVTRPPPQTGLGGYLGVQFVPNIVGRTPAYVEDVTTGSPAEKGGVRVNDLVSFVDGEPVDSIKTFQDYLRRTRPGTTVRLEVRRGEVLHTLEVKLGDWPKGAAPPTPVSPKP